MSIKRNTREMKVKNAEREFAGAFLAIEQKYELTYGEMFEMLGARIKRLAQNLIFDERGEI